MKAARQPSFSSSAVKVGHDPAAFRLSEIKTNTSGMIDSPRPWKREDCNTNIGTFSQDSRGQLGFLKKVAPVAFHVDRWVKAGLLPLFCLKKPQVCVSVMFSFIVIETKMKQLNLHLTVDATPVIQAFAACQGMFRPLNLLLRSDCWFKVKWESVRNLPHHLNTQTIEWLKVRAGLYQMCAAHCTFPLSQKVLRSAVWITRFLHDIRVK